MASLPVQGFWVRGALDDPLLRSRTFSTKTRTSSDKSKLFQSSGNVRGRQPPLEASSQGVKDKEGQEPFQGTVPIHAQETHKTLRFSVDAHFFWNLCDFPALNNPVSSSRPRGSSPRGHSRWGEEMKDIFGLYETFLTNDEPECCDIRSEEQSTPRPKGTVDKRDSCPRTSLTVSSATRLCPGRLKLCVLVLILLHTVLTASAAQNSTGLGLGSLPTLEDNSTRED